MSLADDPAASSSVGQAYQELVQAGAIASDPAQERVAAALDRVLAGLAAREAAPRPGPLARLFARKREAREAPRGLYIHGSVGRGKTMLMDLFFSLVPAQAKRRAHFNDFMVDVHDRIQRYREALKRGEVKEPDPIPPIAGDLAAQASLLCFDEFSVTDIADAMILSRLFSALFERGVVLVATSNVAPDNLYRDGLNRALFLPFVAILKANADVATLDSPTDYRMEKLNRMPVYVTPLGVEADRLMDEAWAAASAGQAAAPLDLHLKGRLLHVPLAAGRAARFAFEDLCEKPLGARDYLALAARYDTFVVDHIPALTPERRSATKRLILLVDTLYDHHARLFASAAVTPERLYQGRPGTTEAFEFDRTVSRLMEMQSRDWLAAHDARLHTLAPA